MKLHGVDEGEEVVVSAGMPEVGFTIDDGSLHVIFDILRSKVYRNPIGSLCREVACNARDSHREAGVPDRPIEIEITEPSAGMFSTEGSRCIVFRDFGVGISPDRMSSVYSKYGASTKRGTNELTGGFGLGAKTPFAYTDAFGVTTVFDGTEYTYSIYIDSETRHGRIALMSDEPTDKGNGTEVVVPLQDADVDRFVDETIASTFFWDVRPVLKGRPFRHGFPQERSVSTMATKEVPGQYRMCGDGAPVADPLNAVIDGVAYPVDLAILGDRIESVQLVMPFANGELTVGANREQLQYDDRTLALLRERVDAIKKVLVADYQAQIKSCGTFLEALEWHREARNRDGLYRSLPASEWNGRLLHGNPYLFKGHKITHVTGAPSQAAPGKFEISRVDCSTVVSAMRDGTLYYLEAGEKPKPGAWKTAVKDTGHYVLIQQKAKDDKVSEASYLGVMEHDADIMSDLGVPIPKDFAKVCPAKSAPRPRKATLTLRTFWSEWSRREEYLVTDACVTLRGKQVRVAYVEVEKDSHAPPVPAGVLRQASSIGDGWVVVLATPGKIKALGDHAVPLRERLLMSDVQRTYLRHVHKNLLANSSLLKTAPFPPVYKAEVDKVLRLAAVPHRRVETLMQYMNGQNIAPKPYDTSFLDGSMRAVIELSSMDLKRQFMQDMAELARLRNKAADRRAHRRERPIPRTINRKKVDQ